MIPLHSLNHCEFAEIDYVRLIRSKLLGPARNLLLHDELCQEVSLTLTHGYNNPMRLSRNVLDALFSAKG